MGMVGHDRDCVMKLDILLCAMRCRSCVALIWDLSFLVANMSATYLGTIAAMHGCVFLRTAVTLARRLIIFRTT